MVIPNWTKEQSKAFEHKAYFRNNDIFLARNICNQFIHNDKQQFINYVMAHSKKSLAEAVRMTHKAIHLYEKCVDVLAVSITNDCNMKCANCVMCSPLAHKENLTYVYTPEQIEKTYITLCKLTDDINAMFPRIDIAGGEPLINPYIIDIIYLTKKYFPNARLHVYTSVFAYAKASDELLNALVSTNTLVGISFYDSNMYFYSITAAPYQQKHVMDCTSCLCHAPFFDKQRNLTQVLNGGIRGDGTMFYCVHAERIFTINNILSTKIPLVRGIKGDIWHINELESIYDFLDFMHKPITPLHIYCVQPVYTQWTTRTPTLTDFVDKNYITT